MLVEQSVGGAQHDKLGAAVQLVGYLLLVLVQMADKLFGQHVALLEPREPLGELAPYGLGLLLAVAYGREPVAGYALGGEIVDHSLGAALREPLVVLGAALVVAVGAQLDGHIAVLVEQRHQFVERLGRLGAQRGLVEVVEDVVYQHRCGDRYQRELQHCLF